MAVSGFARCILLSAATSMAVVNSVQALVSMTVGDVVACLELMEKAGVCARECAVILMIESKSCVQQTQNRQRI